MLAFMPDWASPPGETVAEIIHERGWTQFQLATRLELGKDHVRDIITGRAVIGNDIARRLGRVLGPSAEFWLARESHYREDLVRIKKCVK